MLRDLGGWQQLKTGDKYWAKSGRVNTLKLYKIMGKEDEAPPVVPEEPKYEFPIVRNPVPFQNERSNLSGRMAFAYDQEARRENTENNSRNRFDCAIPVKLIFRSTVQDSPLQTRSRIIR